MGSILQLIRCKSRRASCMPCMCWAPGAEPLHGGTPGAAAAVGGRQGRRPATAYGTPSLVAEVRLEGKLATRPTRLAFTAAHQRSTPSARLHDPTAEILGRHLYLYRYWPLDQFPHSPVPHQPGTLAQPCRPPAPSPTPSPPATVGFVFSSGWLHGGHCCYGWGPAAERGAGRA